MNEPAELPTGDAIAAEFSQKGYVFLQSALEAPRAALLYDHTVCLANRGGWRSDAQVPNTPAWYAEHRMEALLLELLPRIEEASAVSLHPTYSYLRLYKRGDSLARHRDRHSCEVSVSLNLGYEADAPWPLWIEGPGGVSLFGMEPGDALLYRGAECFHWRNEFSGDHAAQVLLHYVNQKGIHAEWKYDKRQSLEVP
jgi:alkylated DNA repair dioxygenase AlkB